MRRVRIWIQLASAIVALASAARHGGAQQPKEYRNSLSVLVGQFIYDYGSDEPYPHASVRATRSLNRFFEAELAFGYSRLSTSLVSIGETIRSYDAHTQLTSADIGIHAAFPLGRFSPYMGVSAGLFRRWSSDDYDGLAQNGSSLGASLGARFMMTQRLGVRGEFHYRSDRHNGLEHRGRDAEQIAGLEYRF